MRKKKTLSKEETFLLELELVYSENKVLVVENQEGYISFETIKESTMDLTEGVSILINKLDNEDSIWNTEIKKLYRISPEKTLYWLSGGDAEWGKMTNYKKPWCECMNIFKDEFGDSIIEIAENASKLSDIRNYFKKYLNLPVLYDFALSKNLIK